MTYREAKLQCISQLETAAIENAVAESGFLMEFVLKTDRSFYLLHQTEQMPRNMYDLYMDVTARRCTHIPLQYLTGEQEFMGIPFKVNEQVLIPRQDTEVLVEEALKVLKDMPEKKVLDLCTGSGCIAISLKAFVPDAIVTGSDISEGALEVARENAHNNNIEVTFQNSDLFSTISESYDMIVSNPPYIPSEVIPTLMPEVREHEPMGALDGADDGLLFYRRIVKECAPHLKKNGYLFFEIGYDQGKAVSELLSEQGFDEIKVIADLAGLDRVVKGRKS